jgi:hypothetical protein
MKIDIKGVSMFCLTCEYDETSIKRTAVKSEFSTMNSGSGPEFIHPILHQNTGERTPKNKSGASGFIRMIEQGLMKQIPGKPFIPFILLEDDVSIMINRDTIDIPDNTDILYIGLSCCSMNHESFHYANYYESVDQYPEIIRIKNMLASHGVMICSPLGAAALQRTMMETWFSDRPWDVPMAYIQPYYHVYALRDPFVYQNESRGGDESCTKITLHDSHRLLPNEFIRCDLATIFVPDKKLISFFDHTESIK